MRSDIEFGTTDGTTLRGGWLYTPAPGGKHPAIVMAHGLSAVKEMYFGASDGEPRQELDASLRSGTIPTLSRSLPASMWSIPRGAAFGARATAAVM